MVARQKQAARAHEQATGHGRVQRVQIVDMDKTRAHVSHQRQHGDRNKSLDRELGTHALPREPVKRNIDDEESRTKRQPRHVVQQERNARRAARQQSRLGKQHHGDGDKQRACEECLRILKAAMAQSGA